MRNKGKYPLTFGEIADHRDYSVELFRKLKPHKDTFIDVVILEGAFLCDNPQEMYETLQIGEKLTLKVESKTNILMAFRQNGEELGKIPFAESIIPQMLISRGISIWAYAEAKTFKSDILEIAVSIYCENY